MTTSLFYPKILKSNTQVFNQILKEKENIGYYNLAIQDFTQTKNKLDSLNIKAKNIAVIGIGGSTLGTSAIYNFLKYSKDNLKELFFFESTDPIFLNASIKELDLKDTLFIIISKSGTTIETISIFKYISSLIMIDKNNCIIISDKKSKLSLFAKSKNISTFDIPPNIGGRFSVFSNVGLIPLYLAGFDINSVLKALKDTYYSFFNKEAFYDKLIHKARTIVQYKDEYNINAIFSYSQLLESFNKWYIQLWGESLGKIDFFGKSQSLTPIGLLGPIDQHSFLQLIIEGKEDKTVTFIKIKNFKDETVIPNISLEHLENLDFINSLKFSDLINEQANATINSLKNKHKNLPLDIIEIEGINEYEISKLMFYYELLTSTVGSFLNINTYDQPGVELGKSILQNELNKNTISKKYK